MVQLWFHLSLLVTPFFWQWVSWLPLSWIDFLNLSSPPLVGPLFHGDSPQLSEILTLHAQPFSPSGIEALTLLCAPPGQMVLSCKENGVSSPGREQPHAKSPSLASDICRLCFTSLRWLFCCISSMHIFCGYTELVDGGLLTCLGT